MTVATSTDPSMLLAEQIVAHCVSCLSPPIDLPIRPKPLNPPRTRPYEDCLGGAVEPFLVLWDRWGGRQASSFRPRTEPSFRSGAEARFRSRPEPLVRSDLVLRYRTARARRRP